MPFQASTRCHTTHTRSSLPRRIAPSGPRWPPPIPGAPLEIGALSVLSSSEEQLTRWLHEEILRLARDRGDA